MAKATVSYPLLVKIGQKLIEVGSIEIEATISPQGNIRPPTNQQIRTAMKKVRF